MSGSERILVVDDDEDLREVLSEVLRDEGYQLQTAIDGQHALDQAERWRPALIVLDLMMPGMDAWAFRAAQRARPAIAEIPIMIVSAAHDLQVRTAALEPAAVLAKPFDLDALVETVRGVVRPS